MSFRVTANRAGWVQNYTWQGRAAWAQKNKIDQSTLGVGTFTFGQTLKYLPVGLYHAAMDVVGWPLSGIMSNPLTQLATANGASVREAQVRAPLPTQIRMANANPTGSGSSANKKIVIPQDQTFLEIAQLQTTLDSIQELPTRSYIPNKTATPLYGTAIGIALSAAATGLMALLPLSAIAALGVVAPFVPALAMTAPLVIAIALKAKQNKNDLSKVTNLLAQNSELVHTLNPEKKALAEKNIKFLTGELKFRTITKPVNPQQTATLHKLLHKIKNHALILNRTNGLILGIGAGLAFGVAAPAIAIILPAATIFGFSATAAYLPLALGALGYITGCIIRLVKATKEAAILQKQLPSTPEQQAHVEQILEEKGFTQTLKALKNVLGNAWHPAEAQIPDSSEPAAPVLRLHDAITKFIELAKAKVEESNKAAHETELESLRSEIKNIALSLKLFLQATDLNNKETEYVIVPSNNTSTNKIYINGKLIGEGGMAQVYLAIDLATGELVAVKRCKANDQPTLARFQEEITNMVEVQTDLTTSPNPEKNAAAHGIGQIKARATNFFVMEYLDSNKWQTLQAFMTGQRLSPDRAIPIIMKILNVMQQINLFHRDLKPENIFITINNGAEIKIVDFGLAKPQAAPKGSSTSMFAGTFSYAPAFYLSGYSQQHKGDLTEEMKRVLLKNDIFYIAGIFYLMLTGRKLTYQGKKNKQFTVDAEPGKDKNKITPHEFLSDYMHYVASKNKGDTAAIAAMIEKYTLVQNFEADGIMIPSAVFEVLAKMACFDPFDSSRSFESFLAAKQALETAKAALSAPAIDQPTGTHPAVQATKVATPPPPTKANDIVLPNGVAEILRPLFSKNNEQISRMFFRIVQGEPQVLASLQPLNKDILALLRNLSGQSKIFFGAERAAFNIYILLNISSFLTPKGQEFAQKYGGLIEMAKYIKDNPDNLSISQPLLEQLVNSITAVTAKHPIDSSEYQIAQTILNIFNPTQPPQIDLPTTTDNPQLVQEVEEVIRQVNTQEAGTTDPSVETASEPSTIKPGDQVVEAEPGSQASVVDALEDEGFEVEILPPGVSQMETLRPNFDLLFTTPAQNADLQKLTDLLDRLSDDPSFLDLDRVNALLANLGNIEALSDEEEFNGSIEVARATLKEHRKTLKGGI